VDIMAISSIPPTTTSLAATPAAPPAPAAAVPAAFTQDTSTRDWGAILKSNPALASVAVEDAVAQGIVDTINVYV
jgi:hypothetical protein